MQTNKSLVFLLGAVSGVLFLLLLRSPGQEAAAQEGKQPFASSIEQRQQTVEELRKTNALLQKQIDLLTSGTVRVIVVEENAEAGYPVCSGRVHEHSTEPSRQLHVNNPVRGIGPGRRCGRNAGSLAPSAIRLPTAQQPVHCGLQRPGAAARNDDHFGELWRPAATGIRKVRRTGGWRRSDPAQPR